MKYDEFTKSPSALSGTSRNIMPVPAPAAPLRCEGSRMVSLLVFSFAEENFGRFSTPERRDGERGCLSAGGDAHRDENDVASQRARGRAPGRAGRSGREHAWAPRERGPDGPADFGASAHRCAGGDKHRSRHAAAPGVRLHSDARARLHQGRHGRCARMRCRAALGAGGACC